MLCVTFFVFVLVYQEFVTCFRSSLFQRANWAADDGSYVRRIARQRSCLKHGCKQNCTNPDGWNLLGSDWGCCDNYDGCCELASRVCYYHDSFCRCCTSWLCLWNCQPEPDCPNYRSHHLQLTTTTNPLKAIKVNESDRDWKTIHYDNNNTDPIKFTDQESLKKSLDTKKGRLKSLKHVINKKVLPSIKESRIDSKQTVLDKHLPVVTTSKEENREIDWMNVMLGDDPGSGE